MKTKEKFIRRLTLGVSGVFSLLVLIAPASAFAAAKVKIPTNFDNKADCVEKLDGYKLKDLKKYGQKRVDNRLVSIDKLRDKVATKAAKNQKVAARLTQETATNQMTATNNGRTPSEAAQQPQNSTDVLNAELTAARRLVADKNGALGSATTSQAAADATCTVIFDANVYGYLYYKITYFHNLDNIVNINAITWTEYGFIRDMAPQLKRPPKSVANLQQNQSVTSASFKDQKNQAFAIQSDILKIDRTNFKSSDFNKVKTDYRALSSKVNGQYKAVHPVYKQLWTRCEAEGHCGKFDQ
jgi:hypothetical protein